MKIRSLVGKLMLPIVLILALASTLTYLVAKNQLSKVIYHDAYSRGVNLAKSLETGIQEALLNTSSSGIQAFIDEYRTLEGVSFIIVVDEDHQLLAHTFTPVIPKDLEALINHHRHDYSTNVTKRVISISGSSHLVIEVPVLAGLLGEVKLGVDLGRVEKEAIAPLETLLLVFNVVVLITIISLTTWMVNRILRPINQLTKAAHLYEEGREVRTVDVDSDGEVQELVDAFNDLLIQTKSYTTRLESEVERRSKIITEQNEKLATASRLTFLGEMSAGIAHEINNPLTVLSTSALVLRKQLEKGQVDHEKFKKYVDDSISMIGRISKIVKGMRNISRDGSNDEMEKTRLGEIFQDSLAICSQKFINNNVELRINLSDPVLEIELMCRRIEISQVIVNLLSNAYDAVVNKSNAWIEVNFKLSGNELQIAVSDSGEGIDSTIASKLFDPFFTTKPVGKGTGLGLSLSLRFVQNHKGKLYLDESASNTRFIMVLPVSA